MQLKKIITTTVFIIFTVIIVAWTIIDEPVEKPKKEKNIVIKEKEEKKEEKTNQITIDIKGAIANPGVYQLTTENNVNDAINMAGGLKKDSDTSNINLSKKLSDEMVIIIYTKKEIENEKNKNEIKCPPCNNACIKEDDEKAKITAKEASEKININTASIEELLTLNGIGEAKANAIIEYRNKNEGFKTTEDIKNVPGIGESAFEKIKNNITV